jgi:hypothetical protein
MHIAITSNQPDRLLAVLETIIDTIDPPIYNANEGIQTSQARASQSNQVVLNFFLNTLLLVYDEVSLRDQLDRVLAFHSRLYDTSGIELRRGSSKRLAISNGVFWRVPVAQGGAKRSERRDGRGEEGRVLEFQVCGMMYLETVNHGYIETAFPIAYFVENYLPIASDEDEP